MSYAIIKSGGKQHRVAVGDLIDVELLKVELGGTVEFNDVMFVHNGEGKDPFFGSPHVENFVVSGEVVDFVAGPKIHSVKYKVRKRSYKKWGHRQHYTRVKITGIGKPHKKDKENTKHGT